MYYELKPMVALLIKKLTAECLWLFAQHSAGNPYKTRVGYLLTVKIPVNLVTCALLLIGFCLEAACFFTHLNRSKVGNSCPCFYNSCNFYNLNYSH